MMNRREILNLGASVAAVSALGPRSTRGETRNEPAAMPVTDTNVNLFQWPFRRLPLDEPAVLVRKLRSLGIQSAWCGSFEAILHRDLSAVNRRLTAVCRKSDELTAIGSVNVQLPGWREDLRQCIREHRMPGLRLHPNYHGYTLNDQRFRLLLETATEADVFIQIAVSMEDTRTQHPLVRLDDVDLSPLITVVPQVPGARIQILNHRLRSPLLNQLARIPGVYFDTARVESTDGVPKLVQSVPSGRVMFGSHAPLLIPEAALIRTHESGQLDADGLRAVFAGNATRFREHSST